MLNSECLRLSKEYCEKHDVTLHTLSLALCGNPAFFTNLKGSTLEREMTEKRFKQFDDWMKKHPTPPVGMKRGSGRATENAPKIERKKRVDREPSYASKPAVGVAKVEGHSRPTMKNVGPSPVSMREYDGSINDAIFKESMRIRKPLNVFLAELAAMGWVCYLESQE